MDFVHRYHGSEISGSVRPNKHGCGRYPTGIARAPALRDKLTQPNKSRTLKIDSTVTCGLLTRVDAKVGKRCDLEARHEFCPRLQGCIVHGNKSTPTIGCVRKTRAISRKTAWRKISASSYASHNSPSDAKIPRPSSIILPGGPISSVGTLVIAYMLSKQSSSVGVTRWSKRAGIHVLTTTCYVAIPSRSAAPALKARDEFRRYGVGLVLLTGQSATLANGLGRNIPLLPWLTKLRESFCKPCMSASSQLTDIALAVASSMASLMWLSVEREHSRRPSERQARRALSRSN
jgi:hypothetical protein